MEDWDQVPPYKMEFGGIFQLVSFSHFLARQNYVSLQSFMLVSHFARLL